MSSAELPEDMQSWPRDAHRLLGIGPNADERELKRAYTRLIRRFKPEHFPQQFGRIRAAYEELLQQRERRSTAEFAESGSFRPLTPTPQPTAESADESSPTDSHPTESVHSTYERRLTFVDRVDSAWADACRGDVDAGYRLLTDLNQIDPGNEEVCLRLYWLQRLNPRLETTKDCSDWLVESLRRHHLRGRAWHVYLAELKRRQVLVDSPGNAALLSAATSPGQLFDFVAVRWRAAADLARWALIETDLELFRPQLLHDHSPVWARMLFLVADLVVWSDQKISRKLAVRCRQELNELSELHLEFAHEFDRYEFIRNLEGCNGSLRIDTVDSEQATILRHVWLDSLDELRPSVQDLLESWVNDPLLALEQLDNMLFVNRAAFYQFAAIIRQLSVDDPAHEDRDYWGNMATRVAAFLRADPSLRYTKLRIRLLKFCLREQITLPEIQLVFQSWTIPEHVHHKWAELWEDLPLIVLLHGIAAFRM